MAGTNCSTKRWCDWQVWARRQYSERSHILVHVTDPSTSTITTVAGEAIIADYDADSISIFSIYVGMTFAKEFTSDAWTVKPSLDLTLIGNFSDYKTEGTVPRDREGNLSTNVSSEVVDNFTYSATLDRAANTSNFSLGLGVNYTGSSNLPELWWECQNTLYDYVTLTSS